MGNGQIQNLGEDLFCVMLVRIPTVTIIPNHSIIITMV